MQFEMDDFEMSIFEKGYPKRIFYKHVTPLRIYYGPNNSIIGFFPPKLNYWKSVNSKNEENELTRKKLTNKKKII